MENPTQFDLNEAIRRWQQNLTSSPAFREENLEELASHLRASVVKLKAGGLSEEEAFLIASRRLGGVDELGCEFGKVNRSLVWRGRAFWMLAGMLVYLGAVGISMLISNTSMLVCSWFLANGAWLGWIGLGTWFSMVVLIVYLFQLVAVGRLAGFTSTMARLLHRRWTAVAVLFCGAVALKAATVLGNAFLIRVLTDTTIRQVFHIRGYSDIAEGPAILMVILVALTGSFSGTAKGAINEKAAGPRNS